MRGRWVPLSAIVLAACQSVGGPDVSQTRSVQYREPAVDPYSVSTGMAAGTPRDLIDNALTQLSDDRFDVSLADPDRGLFILTFSGGPEDFVDCGEFLVVGEGEQRWRGSARSRTKVNPFERYPDWVADRQMQLDARIVTRLQPTSGQTNVATSSTYVLTQIIDVIDGEGAVRGSTVETIDFDSGESGKFAKGTMCHPNGNLERQVASLFDPTATSVAGNAPSGSDTTPTAPIDLAGVEEQPAPADTALLTPAPEPVTSGPAPVLPGAAAAGALATRPPPAPVAPPAPVETPLARRTGCEDIDVAYGGTRGIVITGVVASEDDRQAVIDETRSDADGQSVVDEMSLLPPGGCDAIELARSMGTASLPEFAVKLEGNAESLSAGQTVDLDVTLPGSDRYFYVGYIQEDGVIHHLGPKFIDSTNVGERFLFRTGYEVVPPFGPELILVIASREPIFEVPRPSAEQASTFLRALRARLAEAPQADAVAETMVVRTSG